MAPLFCAVIDEFRNGIMGVHVLVTCKDQFYSTMTEFESYTDAQGQVRSWYPLPSSGAVHLDEPISVNTMDYTRLSVAFLPGFQKTCPPFLAITVDLCFSDKPNHNHTITLAMSSQDATSQIRHTFDQHQLDNDQHQLVNDQHQLVNDQHQLANDQHQLDVCPRSISRQLTAQMDWQTEDEIPSLQLPPPILSPPPSANKGSRSSKRPPFQKAHKRRSLTRKKNSGDSKA